MLNISDKILTELKSSTYSLTPLVMINTVNADYINTDGLPTYYSDFTESTIFLSTRKQELKLVC